MHIELAADIRLQLVDRKALVIDDAFDQIADGDDAYHGAILNDRQMAHAKYEILHFALFESFARVPT